MWSKKNRRGTLEAGRKLSISEWNGAPSEEVTTYNEANTQDDASNTVNGDGQMNIDFIYDAIKRDAKEGKDSSSKDHSFESIKINPDANHVYAQKANMAIASPRSAFKKFTRRTTETSLTIPSSNSDSLYAPTTSNIWTRLLGGNDDLWDKGDVYDDNDDEEHEELKRQSCAPLKSCSRSSYLETRHLFNTMGRYPYIILATFSVFLLVLGAGMLAIQSERGRHIQQMRSSAYFVAQDTGIWFANEFRRAMMPLYGIQQGVIHSGYFDALWDEIGRYPQHVIEDTIGTSMTKRNVTGICDDKDLQAKFRSIVEPVNAENDLNGIVVSYRLFPNNVACLNEPSGESTKYFKLEDFPQGDQQESADMTLGVDAGHSENPFWKMVTEELFIHKELSIFGPLTLPPLKEVICGHLAIWTEFDPEHPFQNVLNIHGHEVHNAFGFIMNFLDWGKLIDRSNIYEMFASRGFEFELNRVSGPVMEGIDRSSLAKSPRSHLLNNDNSIVVETESLHGTWANRVGSINGWEPSWYPAAVATVVLLSLLVAILTASMLVERQLHRDLLYKVMPRRAIKKLQRGQTVLEKFNLVTIFFSDIVGFTSMAGSMRPLQVMAMLNELYCEFDKLVEKHQIYKVETIGDAYMVVGGAPDRVPAPLAAERVALFALDAVNLVREFRTKNGDQIFIRAGLASGPACAGVVGNAMPRYCFFGDTVNFASRMESTSIKMKIQVAELTYRLLQDSPHKTFELEKRKEGDRVGVDVKGKGHQITYWINGSHNREIFVQALKDVAIDIEAQCIHEAHTRVDVNEACTDENSPLESSAHKIYDAFSVEEWAMIGQKNPIVKASEDIQLIIMRLAAILEHHLQIVLDERKTGSVLSLNTKVQLTKFVTSVAESYGNPSFHRLSHALHVVTSMNKVLSMSSTKSDALDDFTLIFAAFVHDAGHTGMTNKMIQEKEHALSKKYPKDVPIAERYAIDIACNLLFQREYTALCHAIMPGDIDKLKFAKVLFQSILVTDIADPNRVRQSVQRFEAVKNGELCSNDLCPLRPHLSGIVAQFFNERSDIEEIYPDQFFITISGLEGCVKREHFMLISDVAHLFQCWENFVKWNFRLYKEIHNNYSRGLCPNPKDGWFEGQIGFLEKYAIPLAMRAQLFLNQDFSELIINLGRANLALWKDHGVQASLIMANGIENGEDENKVLEMISSLHQP